MDADINRMVLAISRGLSEMPRDANWYARCTSILGHLERAMVAQVEPADRDAALGHLDEATSILAGSFGLNPLPNYTQRAVWTMDDIQAEDAEILAEIREEHAGEPWLEYLDD